MTDGVRRLNCSEILQHQFWGIHIFSDIIYQQICTHTIQSASTLQPLTGKVKNTDQFVPMQCASGKPMVLAIMWMQLWHAEQVQTPHGNGIPRWHCPHAGQCAVPHHTAKTAQEWPKKWNINLTVLTRPPASADPNLIKHSWDMQDQVQSMDPASQLTGLGRFTANALNCRQNRPPLKGPVSVSWGVRAESNSQWGLYVWNLFQNVQQMFVRIEI